jgi:hypothetical protein
LTTHRVADSDQTSGRKGDCSVRPAILREMRTMEATLRCFRNRVPPGPDETLAANTLRLCCTNFVPSPSQCAFVRRKRLRRGGAGEGEGAEKHSNFPLSLTLIPPGNT